MVSFAHSITVLLSLGTVVADVAIVLGLLWLAFNRQSLAPLVQWLRANAVVLGLVISTLAVVGSLFFSNVVGYAPCELCWWQRIFIYPQVSIFAVAWVYQRRGKALGPIFSISGILSGLSLLVGLYQYYGATFNAAALAGCAATGVSCAKTYFVEFGYVTIPVMAVTTAALLLTIALARRAKEASL